MAQKFHIKRNDAVIVIAGAHKGKQGKITKLLIEDGKVVVEGVGTVTRHMRPSPRNQQGGKITKDAPIYASKVMPVDPESGKPTRVKIKTAEDNTKTRVGKSGAAITAG